MYVHLSRISVSMSVPGGTQIRGLSMASESALTDFQIEGSHPIACMLFACGMHYNSLMSDHFQPLIAIISKFSPHIFDC